MWKGLLVTITVAAHLTGMHNAIKMLNSRIRVLHHHLGSIQKGNSREDKFGFLICEHIIC